MLRAYWIFRLFFTLWESREDRREQQQHLLKQWLVNELAS